jgi:hypothetical protein
VNLQLSHIFFRIWEQALTEKNFASLGFTGQVRRPGPPYVILGKEGTFYAQN